MPNHVDNTLTITGPLDQLQLFIEKAASQDPNHPSALSFTQFVSPLEVDPVGFVKDWYLWSVEHWGTKWDAYDVSEPTLDENRKRVTFTFTTAWASPDAALIAMSDQHPELIFTCSSEQEWGEGATTVYRAGDSDLARTWSRRSDRPRSLARR